MKDSMDIKGKIDFVLTDEKGLVKQTGHIENQIQTAHGVLVADRIGGGADPLFTHMWVGTGTGQVVASTDLSAVIAGGRQAVTSSAQVGVTNVVTAVATFLPTVGTGIIHEIGMFSSNAAADMKCYNDAISLTKGAGDTLTVTWSVTYG